MPRRILTLAALLAIFSAGATAHVLAPTNVAAVEIAPAHARTESVAGTVEALPVHDRRTGESVTYFALRLPDGSALALDGLAGPLASPGTGVLVEGRRSGNGFVVDRAHATPGPVAAERRAATQPVQGTLEILYADDFETGGHRLVYALRDASMRMVEVRFATAPAILEQGMLLDVQGIPAADGGIEAVAIDIVAGPSFADRVAPAISGTTQVLVIVIKYSDTTTAPHTQAMLQDRVFNATNSVANYYREASYGRHLLAGAVTPLFTARFAKPTTCDYSKVSNEARALAQSAGYNLANYAKFVYVFPRLPGCGWDGLGGGANAWINENISLLVIGHELGHTFGLGHASSLDCGADVVGTTCSRSEYGDPYEIMGNQRASHFSAPYKQGLGYFLNNELRTHGRGSATYELGALATPGRSTYAVRVLASPTRTYWLEWRQPIGFDANVATGASTGAMVHVTSGAGFGCSNCVLDMKPGTATFTDGALAPGSQWTDEVTGTTLAVVSQGASALTVQVTTPEGPTFTDVPTTHSAYDAIETLYWHGITRGCSASPRRYCPDALVTRAEMAVFLQRAKRGATFQPTATGARFVDVPVTHSAAGFIEQLEIDGITSGCAISPARYCPDALLTRAEMAPLFLRARMGGTYNPGTATGNVFGDVPRTHSTAAWIERMFQMSYTAGCTASPRNYCPDAHITRAQMALFIKRVFGLASPPA